MLDGSAMLPSGFLKQSHMKKAVTFAVLCVSFLMASNAQTAADFLNKGRSLMSEGSFSQAIRQFETAMYLDNNWAEPVLLRGISWRHLGDTERFMIDLKKAHQLDPGISNRLLRAGKHFPSHWEQEGTIPTENFERQLRWEERDWNFAEHPFRGLNSTEGQYWNTVFTLDIDLKKEVADQFKTSSLGENIYTNFYLPLGNIF